MSYAEKVRPRLRLPASAAPDVLIEAKTLLSHSMEWGHRVDGDGEPIPSFID